MENPSKIVSDNWFIEMHECGHIVHWPDDWPDGHGQSAPKLVNAVVRCPGCYKGPKNWFEYRRVKALAIRSNLLGNNVN